MGTSDSKETPVDNGWHSLRYVTFFLHSYLSQTLSPFFSLTPLGFLTFSLFFFYFFDMLPFLCLKRATQTIWALVLDL